MSRSVSAPSSVTNTSPCWNGDIVPGSTLMYGSSLMLVTRIPRDSRIAAREAAAMPFPREETTPPVTKTYLVIYLGRVGMEEFTGTPPSAQMRRMIFRTFLLLAAVFATPAALAQNAPALVRLVVPFPPGGSNDVIARAIAPPLAKRLGTSVIVENKAGAAGVIGSEAVAKAPADGSHLLLTSSTYLTTAATQAKLPYDPLASLVPIAMVAEGPLLVAVPSERNIRTPADLVAAAKAKPGALNYGTAGVGS